MSEPDNNMATIIESRPLSSRSSGIKLLVLASWAAIAAGGWLLWQQRQTIAVLETQIGTLSGASNEVGSLQQAQTTVLQQLQMTMSSLSDQSQQIYQLGTEVESLQARVAGDGSAALRAQLLMEAAGMLRIAELRLQLAHDSDTASTLVRSADAVVARVNDPAVAGLRSRLANDLAALQAAPQVDVLALHRQLGDVISQLDSLTVVSTEEVADLRVTPVDNGLPAEPGWFNEAADFLGQYFVLTKRDAAIAPLLSPVQDWLIRKSIALQLQQAQLAALKGNAEVYKVALTEARLALDTNLQGSNKAALLAQLGTLTVAVLRTQPPSLAVSIAALQQLQSAPAAGTTP